MHRRNKELILKQEQQRVAGAVVDPETAVSPCGVRRYLGRRRSRSRC